MPCKLYDRVSISENSTSHCCSSKLQYSWYLGAVTCWLLLMIWLLAGFNCCLFNFLSTMKTRSNYIWSTAGSQCPVLHIWSTHTYYFKVMKVILTFRFKYCYPDPITFNLLAANTLPCIYFKFTSRYIQIVKELILSWKHLIMLLQSIVLRQTGKPFNP